MKGMIKVLSHKGVFENGYGLGGLGVSGQELKGQ